MSAEGYPGCTSVGEPSLARVKCAKRTAAPSRLPVLGLEPGAARADLDGFGLCAYACRAEPP